MRGRGETLGQLVLVRGVARHQAQHEVVGPARHVALAHLRPAAGQGLEVVQHRLRLAVQADQREEGHLEAQGLGVQVGVVALDEAGFLQGAHAPEAGRRRDAGAPRQLHVGDPSVFLEVLQDLQVDSVQFDPPHGHPRLGKEKIAPVFAAAEQQYYPAAPFVQAP